MTQLGTKKSRKGCTNCKRRRVKCNEQAPCANCTRRGEPCSLLGVSASQNELRFNHNAQMGLPSTHEEWLQDLELLNHYNHDPSLQPLGIGDDMQHIRRESIPGEATRHPFLMHGILALSALHIAHERPIEAERYVRLCDRHQTKALEMFRCVLSNNISPEINTALFALSSTLSVLSIARSCADALAMPEPRFIGLEQITELFALTRGVRDLIDSCSQRIPSAPFEPVLSLPQTRNALPPSVERQFLALHQMLLHSCSPEYLIVCETALRYLEDVYRHVCHLSRSSSICSEHSVTNIELETSHIWRWILLVPNEFVRMISAGFPPALIILAHFAAVTTTIRTSWYTKDWGHSVLMGIGLCLHGVKMHEYMQWALEQARDGMAILSQPSATDSVINGNSPCNGFAHLGDCWDTPLSLDHDIADDDMNLMNFWA